MNQADMIYYFYKLLYIDSEEGYSKWFAHTCLLSPDESSIKDLSKFE